MKLFSSLASAALIALSLAGAVSAQTSAKSSEPALADFFRHSDFEQATLSPNGGSVAYIRPNHGRRNLAVYDIATKKRLFVTNFNDVDIATFGWVNDDRLFFLVDDLKVGVGDREVGGLRAVNKDGSGLETLTEGSLASAKSRLLGTSRGLSPRATFFSRVRSGDPDDIIMVDSYDNPPRTQLLRVNTKSGRFVQIGSDAPGNVLGWALDEQDQPRAVESVDKGNATVYVRSSPNAAWQKAFEYSIYDSPPISPIRVGPDNTLYFSAAMNRDTSAIYRFDWQKMKLEDAFVFAAREFDLGGGAGGGLLFDPKSKQLVGIRYMAETYTTHWVSAEMAAIQKTVDDSLPGRFNLLGGSPNSKTGNVLVASWTADTPTAYFVFDPLSRRLTRIGVDQPWFANKTPTRTEFFRYAARDGMSIPGSITYPAGAKVGEKLPMVALVHGGPYVRGVTMNWDREVQTMAAAGFAVFQPDFRGSRGHGWKHYKAGWRQWGLAMQDDIADGVAHLVKSGNIDPARVCIAGASYGGYATVFGLIKHPEIYKCGISWVGVTSIDLLYSVGWSDSAGSEWARYGMPILVGDLTKDREQIKATSAVEQAARLKAPLILAYGTADVRVPFDHGKALVSRLRGHNPNVQYIEYPGEGHGWRVLENNVDFWTRSIAFLKQHIGK
jgi:dipeptidyl aminopeptidase/acylaminoacyl peptidase